MVHAFLYYIVIKQDKKSVEYEGFSDEALGALVKSQQISADTTEEAMEMVRALLGDKVPPFQVARSSFGGYVLRVNNNHAR